MTFEPLLDAAVIFLYSLGTLCIFLGTLSARRKVSILANWLTFAGFALHSVNSLITLGTHSYAELSAGYFTQLFAWSIVLVYLFAWRWLRLPFFGITTAPLALLLFALSMRQEAVQQVLPEHLSALFVGLHLTSLFVSMGLLAMAFGAGIVFVYVERKLKRKSPLAEFARDLPALSTCDKVNQIAVLVGFPLYTLGIMAGFVWAPMLLRSVENPKVIVSLGVWFLYALLFYQRASLGYRGRKTAVMAVFIFIISVLSVGIDFTMQHHSKWLLP